MVKFKKIRKIIFVFLSIALIITASFSFVSCFSSELDKVAKGLTTYNISASIDNDMKIKATENVEYKNNTGDNLNYICFHLYPRAFRKDATIKPYTSLTMASCFPNGLSYGDIEIQSVMINENNAGFEIIGDDEDILKVNLGYELENKKSANISIEFFITLPNCTHRFGYYENNINLGNWYPIACCYSEGKFDLSPYYSTGDPFFSDMANYNVNITYPNEYSIVSTGDFVVSKNEKGNVASIKAKAVRDFAMSLSKNSQVVSTKVGSTTINYIGYKDDLNLQSYLDLSVKSFEYFSSIFGKYPYASLSVIKTPFIYGGMEYPNIVFISDAIDDEDEYKKVIVHEIAHQWWYGVVGNNEVKEAWLDESLTEYSTALFFENNKEFGIDYDELISNAISSYTLYVDVIGTIRDNINTKMNLAINEYQNDYEYSYMIYVKGVIMFDELKNVVGENRVIKGLEKYYKDNKFKNATKDDFYLAFKSVCHKDLEGFFEGYLNGSTVITNVN